jgi:hypothetical protein
LTLVADPPLDPPRLRRRILRRALFGLVAVVLVLVLLLVGGWITLLVHDSGTPSPAARSTGNDAEWLGHGWVDGHKTQADVDALALQLRGTGIRDLFVHAGPFNDDGTLDPSRRPRGRWLLTALHAALPGVRVQAWLGDRVGPGRMDLDSAATRTNVVTAAGQVLDDGFDGIHYDFEPVHSGDPGLLQVLAATRAQTSTRSALLSVSATYLQPVAGLGAVLGVLPGHPTLWSTSYLHQVAVRVNEVALMAYDTALPSRRAYGGYVRRQTELALRAVPDDVTLLIGLPAYHENTFKHHSSAETVAASLRGIRLALGSTPPPRPFGVSMYVDYAASRQDWASYRSDWALLLG